MKRDTRIVAAVLGMIAGSLLLASTACTWFIAHGASIRWRLLFRIFCHGIPERCFYLWHVPMPLCARCVAIYCGLAAGIAIFWIAPRLQELSARKVMIASAIPLAIDGLTQLAMLRESTNTLRLITGLIAGIAFAFWALTAVETVETRVFTSS
jgi:uncharacterized membrane protein